MQIRKKKKVNSPVKTKQTTFDLDMEPVHSVDASERSNSTSLDSKIYDL